jgi:citrate synthase
MNLADDGAGTQPPDMDIHRAKRLLHAMAGAFGMIGPRRRFTRIKRGETIAHLLARALGVAPTRSNLAALDAVLVLVADHELTPATFAARIAASVGCDLYPCIGAALQVQFGTVLGLRSDRVEQLLAASAGEPRGHRDGGQRAGPHTIGFRHPLYANGDPRAEMLLELACEHGGKWPPRSALDRGHLTLDEALVIFCRALGVAGHAAGGLLALGRAAGWIAHVFEQREQGLVIRPRAKFVETPAGSERCAE